MPNCAYRFATPLTARGDDNTEVNTMKKLLTLSTIALVALSMGIGAKAAPQETRAALERKVAWQDKHIRQLQHRRAYLHRYIRHLRAPSPYAASVPVHTTSTSYTGGVLSASQVASYARGAGFPESVIPEMVAIAYRESRFNPAAINSSSGACGIWQILPAQPGCTNPASNAAMAYAKYRASGLQPWGG